MEPAILVSDVLAIASAVFFGAANVVAKRGNLAGATAAGGYFVNILVSTAFFTVLLPFIFPSGPVSLYGVALFALSGVAGTLTGRALQYVAINRMGASTAAPLVNTSPIFAAALAIGFIGEGITALILAGTLLTILGVALLSGGDAPTRGWRTRYLAVPLASAFFIGVGTVFRKVAIAIIPNPAFGVAITTYTALLVYLPFVALNMRKERFRLTRQGSVYFAVVGVLSSLALLAQFAALTNGLVVVVAPLNGIAPIFTVLLAFVFLRRHERFTYRLVLAILLVVAGVVLVTA